MRFLRGDTSMVAEHLKLGDAELAIAGPLGQTWERLESWKLFHEPYRLVVGKGHRLASRAAVPASELVNERFLNRTYCENIAEIGAFLRANSVDQDFSHKVANENDLVALLEANLGYALAPQSSVQQSANVWLLDVEGLDVMRTVCVYAVAGRQRSAAANALIKSLRAADWSAFEEKPMRELTSRRA